MTGARRERRADAAADAAPALTVRWTRVSATHHRLELQRGTEVTARLLETRSVLLHDLVHFALESEARLAGGFYGRLARGIAHDELAAVDATTAAVCAEGDELVAIERVVGALQGAWRAGLEPAAFLARCCAWLAQCGEPSPPWLTEELLARFAARLRALAGRWRATKFGDTMELVFAAGRGEPSKP